jgi:hypothetical protein
MDQPFFMPPDMHDWLPEGDITCFVSSAIDWRNLSAILRQYCGAERRGRPACHPRMMVKLILSGFVAGVGSSRKLEAATCRPLDFRVLVGDQHPDHESLAAFHKTHFAELATLPTPYWRSLGNAAPGQAAHAPPRPTPRPDYNLRFLLILKAK